MIICGERRFRAAKLVGLERIPAYIKTAEDDNIMEMALLENIQREDLSAIEIALTYQKLIDNSGQTQEQLSERVGKRRTTVSNYLRLLKLPAEIQVGIKNRKIDMGHARALITMDDPEVQLALYERILQEGLSVRNVEEIARDINNTGVYTNNKTNRTQGNKLPEEFKLLKEHLSSFFDTKIQLSYNSEGKGKITIPFDSDEKLENIISLLDRMK
jgi:ParB family chromosome partitioning protein